MTTHNYQSRNEKIEDALIESNAPPFRWKQVYRAVYKDSSIKRYSEIFNIPGELRNKLSERMGDEIISLEKEIHQENYGTEKVLFRTVDNYPIETVKMHYENGRNTYCISVQSGCAMGCAFCATGKMGLNRNLTRDEIVDQVLYFRKNGYEVDNIVFMGMGEPFANPETYPALDILTDQKMFELGKRHISVSTVGIVPGIKRMTEHYPQINLALSLHTPFQDQRERLVPIAKSYPVRVIMDALADHIRKTNRKVFIAYILLGGVTDTYKHAEELARLINSYEEESYLFHVNLINYHEIPGEMEFKKSSEENLERFRKILYDAGIRTTVRQDFGESIDAACGQLSV